MKKILYLTLSLLAVSNNCVFAYDAAQGNTDSQSLFGQVLQNVATAAKDALTREATNQTPAQQQQNAIKHITSINNVASEIHDLKNQVLSITSLEELKAFQNNFRNNTLVRLENELRNALQAAGATGASTQATGVTEQKEEATFSNILQQLGNILK